MYNPDFDTSVPESGQALSIINEIDLDEEEDMDPLQNIEDETIHLKPLPTPRGSTVTGETQTQASDAHPPSPVSITRNERVSDVSAIKNLRSSGRTVRLSKRGQDAIDALSPRQVHKRARRHAHALRLGRAKIGDQVAHAFAQARIIKTHRKDLPPPPETWYQLKRHPERKGLKQAADLEIKSLKEKGAFELVDHPKDKQVLPLKWVFSYKFDQAGYLDKHKARICARGDLQHYTGEDIYAATGAYRSFRILMAIVCAYGFICHQIDFKLAFINAYMDEEVYTTCPPGYGRPGKVWRLLKALYGLRKSPKLWYKELVSFLQGLGFEPCTEEPCIMINRETKLVLFLFVDDMLIIAPSDKDQEVEQFKQDVQNKYDIKDLGEASSFLNIRIRRDIKAKKLWICQDGYIDKICVKFGIDETKPTVTPLPSSYHPLPYEGQATIQQIMEMQEKVGSILYPAVVTRPDISFAASQLSQFTLNPSQEHLRYVNRVLSYLQTTKYYAIEFSDPTPTKDMDGEKDDEVLLVSSDASFADDPETRKSTQGYLMRLFNGPIMWQSSKQKTVTTSTTEAELLSLSHTARETIALYRLFANIEFDPEHLPSILCDNQQTVGLVHKERPQLMSKLKHVDIHNLWLRQIHQEGKIKVQWVPTTSMPADGFTKPLSAEKHSQFVKQLGLIDISAQVNPDYEDMEYSTDIQTSSDTE